MAHGRPAFTAAFHIEDEETHLLTRLFLRSSKKERTTPFHRGGIDTSRWDSIYVQRKNKAERRNLMLSF